MSIAKIVRKRKEDQKIQKISSQMRQDIAHGGIGTVAAMRDRPFPGANEHKGGAKDIDQSDLSYWFAASRSD